MTIVGFILPFTKSVGKQKRTKTDLVDGKFPFILLLIISEQQIDSNLRIIRTQKREHEGVKKVGGKHKNRNQQLINDSEPRQCQVRALSVLSALSSSSNLPPPLFFSLHLIVQSLWD